MNDEPTNDYPDWGLLGAWVAVVESESVSHAARRLGLSPAAVSMPAKVLDGDPPTHPPHRPPSGPPPPPHRTTARPRAHGARTEGINRAGAPPPGGGGPSCAWAAS